MLEGNISVIRIKEATSKSIRISGRMENRKSKMRVKRSVDKSKRKTHSGANVQFFYLYGGLGPSVRHTWGEFRRNRISGLNFNKIASRTCLQKDDKEASTRIFRQNASCVWTLSDFFFNPLSFEALMKWWALPPLWFFIIQSHLRAAVRFIDHKTKSASLSAFTPEIRRKFYSDNRR